MDGAAVALPVGIVATVISLVLLVPQIVRLVRTGRTEGVSPSWAALGTTINFGWLVYVIVEGVWVAVPADVVATTSFALTLCLLWRNGADVAAGVLASAIAVAGLVGVQLRFGWTAVGAVLALSYLIQFVPSVVTAWRTHAPVGLSPATWLLALAEAISWGLYGALIGNGPFVLFGALQAATAALVLLRIHHTADRIRLELDRASARTTP